MVQAVVFAGCVRKVGWDVVAVVGADEFSYNVVDDDVFVDTYPVALFGG